MRWFNNSIMKSMQSASTGCNASGFGSVPLVGIGSGPVLVALGGMPQCIPRLALPFAEPVHRTILVMPNLGTGEKHQNAAPWVDMSLQLVVRLYVCLQRLRWDLLYIGTGGFNP
jgi:hypothetical protein